MRCPAIIVELPVLLRPKVPEKKKSRKTHQEKDRKESTFLRGTAGRRIALQKIVGQRQDFGHIYKPSSYLDIHSDSMLHGKYNQ